MVLKITELRKQYGVYPEFETEAEELAYNQEREQAYKECVAQKVAELKALYNSNPKKYAKFKNFTEADWTKYAQNSLSANTFIRTQSLYNGLLGADKDPETAKWARFTYEEILQMESNGTLIPDEVLAWAHSMQDSDVTAYEINDDPSAAEDTEGTGENSPNSELEELQKKTQTLGKKSENTTNEVNEKFVEFEETAKRAETVKKELETSKKDSLKQIEGMTKEWEELSAKLKNGSKLSESEQKRMKELGSMLNGEDGEMMTDLQTSSEELEELMNSMDGLNADVKEGIELGDDTVDMAKQLAMYERGYDKKNLYDAAFVNVNIGDIKDVLYGAQGQSIARDALENGNKLIEFSNTLSSQLMMNQYASLYEFAEIFTQTSTETISNTKEVLGNSFNKTTEEINEDVDALPDMTNAENDRNNLQQNGVSLIGQALFFNSKSTGEIFNSLGAMKELNEVQKVTESEKEKSQILTDKIVEETKSKKEELDTLKEKQEKAEEKNEVSQDAINDINNPKDVQKLEEASKEVEENPQEEEFTEKDKQRLDSLQAELEKTGEKGQQKLFESLSKVEGLAQILETKPMDGLAAVDYGVITQEVGLELMKKYPPFWYFLFVYMLGLHTVVTGAAAEAIGNENNDMFIETSDMNAQSAASIGANQVSVQEVTTVEGMGVAAAGEESEETNDTEENSEADETAETSKEASDTVEESDTAIEESVPSTPAPAAPSDKKLTGAAAIVASMSVAGAVNDVKEKTAGMEKPEKSSKKEEDKEEMTTESAQNNVNDMQKGTEAENADSLEKKAETEKTEKQLTKEMKKLQKQMKSDEKSLIKMAKDAAKIAKEKEQMAEEFEQLQAENDSIVARQESQQNSAPMAVSPADNQQGGLLQAGAQSAQPVNDESSTIQANQTRMVQISAKFNTYDRKLDTYKTKINRLNKTNKKRSKKFNKLARAKNKVIKEHEKAEAAKQAKVQKSLAVVGIINNLFSVVLSVGTILLCWPTTAAAGAKMVAVGTKGLISCALLKSTILIASGNFQAAIMTMGMAAIQIATSLIPGAGAAAGSVTSAVGAGLSIVSAAADTAAQVQTLSGKQQSGWLNTVSQIAGIAGSLTSMAAGFTNGKNIDSVTGEVTKTASAFSQAGVFGKVTQVVGAVGTVASSTAQISTLIKQSQGKEAGSFENILGIIGGSLQTASALMALGSQIAGGGKKDSENGTNESQNNESANDKKVSDNDTKAEGSDDSSSKGTETGAAAPVAAADSANANEGAMEQDIKAAAEQAAEAVNNSDTKVDDQTAQKVEGYKEQQGQESANQDAQKVSNEKAREAARAAKQEARAAAKQAKQEARATAKAAKQEAKTTAKKANQAAKKQAVESKKAAREAAKNTIKNAETKEQKQAARQAKRDAVKAANEAKKETVRANNQAKQETTRAANETKRQAISDANKTKKELIANAVSELKTILAANKSTKTKSAKKEEIQDVQPEVEVKQDEQKPQSEVKQKGEVAQDTVKEAAEGPENSQQVKNYAAEAEAVEGAPSAEKIAQNPDSAEAELDAKIAQGEQASQDGQAEQVSQDGKTAENDTYVDENGIVRKKLEPVLSDEQKAQVDNEMTKAPELKASAEDIKVPAYKNEAQQKYERKQKMDKAVEILGTIGQAASAGMQVAQAVSSFSKDEDNTEQKRKVLNLSNMKKGKALIKKVKQRRQASKPYNKYYA